MKEKIEEFLSNLEERERLAILIVLPLAILLLYYFLLFLPLSNFKESCERKEEAFRKRVEKVKTLLSEYQKLKAPLLLVEDRIPSSSFDPASYVKEVFGRFGVKVKRVKLSDGGKGKKLITVSFKESPLNEVGRAIFNLENSRYYFKSLSVEISDQDGNGLVSGKVTFLFFRREQ